jgi:pimeloyl-ACP methyl ester carboxylesterase
VYSRPGYGRSTPRAPQDRWGVDFMHRQAHEVLPMLLQVLGVAEAPWLFGHSDGASIALLHAAGRPDAVQGLVVLAPHVFVEEVTVHSIVQARQAYETTDLPRRLARYHDDPDSAFGGWCGIWLDPAFRHWDIVQELAPLSRAGLPVLAVQGENDEYGTLAQIDAIAQQLAGTEQLVLPQCGHSPHRDQRDAVIAATVAFVQGHHRASGAALSG